MRSVARDSLVKLIAYRVSFAGIERFVNGGYLGVLRRITVQRCGLKREPQRDDGGGLDRGKRRSEEIVQRWLAVCKHALR